MSIGKHNRGKAIHCVNCLAPIVLGHSMTAMRKRRCRNRSDIFEETFNGKRLYWETSKKENSLKSVVFETIVLSV